MGLKKFLFGGLFFLAGCLPALADGVTPAAVANGGAVTRDGQLVEIRDVMRGGRGEYIDLGMYYTPSSEQLPLQSKYGTHDGFAFNQHIAGFGAGQLSRNGYLGALLWVDRSGWDGEDFFLFPHYSEQSLVRSVTTWGLVYTDRAADVTVAAGMQHDHLEYAGSLFGDVDDSLAYSWAHLRWNHFSLQGNFYRTDWRALRLSLDLESRAVYGGKASGPLTYLPNVDLALYNGDETDSLRVTWEQNLYDQKIYGDVSFDFPEGKMHAAALKYYPHPSRMVGFEVTCVRRGDGFDDLLWGGAVDLLFLRLAYNASYEYDHLFGAKGTFLAEIKFSMAILDGAFFGRGATSTTPMETDIIKKSRKNDPNAFPDQPKTVEAKGVRYEKNRTNSTKGNP